MDKLSTFLKSLRGEMKKSRLLLIWFLVIAKLSIGRVPCFTPEADCIMSAITGIMFGRLGGIGLRVRRLKLQHGFLKS
ncbi:MAG: hypothetical protein ACUVRJ_01960 [Candidatus Villigracilaceae bacterium]